MTLAIQGSFEAYISAALWQVTLACLQSGAPLLNRQAAGSDWIVRLQQAASLTGSTFSWIAWGLGVWIAVHESILAGILYVVFSVAVNVLTLIEMRRLVSPTIMVQFMAFIAMPVFSFMTLNSVGIFNS